MGGWEGMIFALIFFYVSGSIADNLIIKLFSSFVLFVTGICFLNQFLREQGHTDGTPFEEFTVVLGCAFWGGVAFAGILLFPFMLQPISSYYKLGYFAVMIVLFGLLYGAITYEFGSRKFVKSFGPTQ